MEKIIVITGPTASGKTSLSLELASILDAEIISADSRQIFKYMDIGTAKPTKTELNAAKHHFIDELEPDKYFSAGEFGDRAYERIIELKANGKNSIVVGGSGFYVKALFEGLFEDVIDESRIAIREQLNERFKYGEYDNLRNELQEVDPVSFEIYKDKNPRRIIKALEHFLATGRKLSDDWKSRPDDRSEIEPIYFAIDMDRDLLYDRINLRCDQMWEQGLVEETQKLLSMGFPKDLNSLNTVGYKEVIAFLNSSLSREEAIEEMKKNTRRFAKRQLTWCRNQIPDLNWIRGSNKNMIEQILEIKKRQD